MSDWKSVPTLVRELIKEGSTMFARLREALHSLPRSIDYGYVWFNPKTHTVFFSLGDSDEKDVYDAWTQGLKVKGVKEVMGDAEAHPPKDKGPWLRVKTANVLTPLAQLGGWQKGPVAGIFGGPNPLSATIASGVLGAGAGYGLGALAEQVLPENYFKKKKLRRTLGLMGGLAGAIPGFWTGTVNMRHGTGWLDPIGSTATADTASEPSTLLDMTRSAAAIKSLNDMLDVFAKPDRYMKREMNKLAAAFGGGGFGPEPIEKDRFNRALWEDPYLPPAVKGMAAGLAEGATTLAGNDEWFRPADTARLGASMAANAAVGWSAGALAGKVMGALTGLTDPGQRALQRIGVFSGLVNAVVPRVFGGSSGRNAYEFYG